MLTVVPQTIPTVHELRTDLPLRSLAPALAHLPGLALLEGNDAGFGYLTADPFDRFEWSGGGARSRLRGELSPAVGLSSLTAWLAPYATESQPGVPPFQGGAIGEIEYETGYLLDRVRDARVPTGARLTRFRLYDWVVARDNSAGRSWLICHNFDPRPGHSVRDRLALFARPTPPAVPATASPAPIRCDLDAAAYAVMVERCLDYIAAGDVYQVNVARRLFGSLPCSPWQIYEQLRETYPAPMAAFLQHSSGSTISISPETFLQGDSNGIETRPIKGTRPRGRNPAEDGRLAVDLQSSTKDRAENVMIVDVLRNDLGRIAAAGTVAVPELFGLRSLPTVHHLESRVTATPRPGISPADVLTACFPGGSVTGAPKIRAMEIIAELEPVPRGRYCGAIAAIGFDGYLTSSIPIRTIYTHGDRFQFHVGGGIVADSDPALEYEETRHKADALLRILSSS